MVDSEILKSRFSLFMAASANPAGNQEGIHTSSFNGVSVGVNPINGKSVAMAENSGPTQTLRHNPGISVEWTADELFILDEGLIKYASESTIVRYAKIAMELPDKTVRDIAMRCRWMTKKESSKRRKEDHNFSKKNKDKKEKFIDLSTKSSHLAARPNLPPYALPMIPIDNDDDISYKDIGGATGQMLEQNAQFFKQISANLAAYQIQENINLFYKTRDNIFAILNEMNDMPGIMKQMPPIPVKVNEELANSILSRIFHPMQP